MLPESAINDSGPQRRFDRGQARRMVRKWNVGWPAGTRVKFWNRFGDPPIETATSSEAFLADSGLPVIELVGRAGYVSLFHVLPAAAEPATGEPSAGTSVCPPVSTWLDRPIAAEAACDVEVEGEGLR